MRIVDIEEVRANMEQLIDELKPGEWFAISVEGASKVKVVALFPEEIEQLKSVGQRRERKRSPRSPKGS